MCLFQVLSMRLCHNGFQTIAMHVNVVMHMFEEFCVFNISLFTLNHLQYKLMRCSNKECCKQCRYVMFIGTMTKWPVQKQAQGTTQKLLQHHDATDI